MSIAEKYCEHNLLSIEGQITFFLMECGRSAGDIYEHVSASQPTISKKIARLLDQGIIELKPSAGDRRVSIYVVTDSFKRFLASASITKTIAESVLQPPVASMIGPD